MENNKLTSNDAEFNFDAALEELTNIDIPLHDEPNQVDVGLDIDTTEILDIDSTFDASVLDIVATTTPRATDDSIIDDSIIDDSIIDDSIIDDSIIDDSANVVNKPILTEADYSVAHPMDAFESDISLDGDFSQGISQDPNQEASSFDNIANDGLNNIHNTADLAIDEANMVADAFTYDEAQSSVPTNDFHAEFPEVGGSIDVSALGNEVGNEVHDDSLGVAPPPPSLPTKKQGNTTKLLKILAVIIALAILGLLAFLFLGVSDTTPEEKPVAPAKTAPVTSEVKAPEVKPIDELNKSATPKIVNAEVPEKVKTANTDTVEPSVNKNKLTEVESKSAEKSVTKPVVGSTEVNTPDPKAILNAEIPKDEVLVKEELDKLNDQDERMVEQKDLLGKRVEMMDELTTKKQEQIELLEKQIAQLEAAQKDIN